MTKKEANSSGASARPRRTPLDKRNRLSIRNPEPGYMYRLVNDEHNRISDLQEQGYEICEKEHTGLVGDKRVDGASPIGSVSMVSVGQGQRAVVMRQREEDYREDQAIKQAEIDEIERTMGKEKSDYGSIQINPR